MDKNYKYNKVELGVIICAVILIIAIIIYNTIFKGTVSGNSLSKKGKKNITSKYQTEKLIKAGIKKDIKKNKENKATKNDSIIDYSKMGKDMEYASVYQMEMTPNDYMNKTVVLKGNYYSGVDSQGKSHNYCVITCQGGCCVQGVEFIMDERFKDDKFKDNQEIIVEGKFEIRDGEKGGKIIVLRDAIIKLK